MLRSQLQNYSQYSQYETSDCRVVCSAVNITQVVTELHYLHFNDLRVASDILNIILMVSELFVTS